MRGIKHLRRLNRWIRSRLTRGGLILLYHRVSESAVDPWDLCVSPRNFRDQMAALRRWASPMTLVDLVTAAQRRELPPRAVTVTFDDGYRDVLTNALPGLTEHEIPATVFATTGNFGESFWWDRLAWRIIAGTSPSLPLRIETGDRSYHGDTNGTSEDRLRILADLHALCCEVPLEVRSSVLQQVEASISVGLPEDNRAMTAGEIVQLATSPLITMGAHTVNHPALVRLSPGTQHDELKKSRMDLESIIGKPVTTMAYPFGVPGEHYDGATVKLARRAGYTHACAANGGSVTARTDAWQLPRFWVSDWSGEELIRRLRTWIR